MSKCRYPESFQTVAKFALSGNVPPPPPRHPLRQLPLRHHARTSLFHQHSNSHLAIVEDISLSPPVIVGLAKWVFLPENSTLPGLFTSDMDLPQEPHWYLALIVTLPDYKGSGAGRLLMEWGIKKVDEDEQDAYLEASPEGKPLFEKYGFRVEEVAEYLDGSYIERSMVRDAKKTE
ncbi:putative acetyltransferase, GNAT family [Cercophora samala]|uniref:Acetyltransferase, GNAT family n=1 Tax=Cercophora samala TaxID=330535 RepID=A0AA40D2R8_9PEZI|nr:putative acetyltransferase, GNAT family [Cercophora samala]